MEVAIFIMDRALFVYVISDMKEACANMVKNKILIKLFSFFDIRVLVIKIAKGCNSNPCSYDASCYSLGNGSHYCSSM